MTRTLVNNDLKLPSGPVVVDTSISSTGYDPDTGDSSLFVVRFLRLESGEVGA